jgi:O-antigen/teichoic acid export membrane protein
MITTSVFARNVLTLVTGTGLAQALPIAISPILTRLYTPEDLGVFALYVSVCAVLAAIVTGKYEIAIIVPKNERAAINLMGLAILISLAVSCAILGVLLVLGEQIASAFDRHEIALWIYLVPITTLTLGFFYALNLWVNRRARYKDMASSRVVQSGTGALAQLLSGVANLGPSGLIVGQLFGQLVSTVFLARSLPRAERSLCRNISKKRMLWAARRYIEYPKYMIPGQAMSVAAAEMPLILITILFGPIIAGFYSLAQRVMAAPLSLLASAIGDVYRQKAAEQFAARGECRDIFLVSFRRLILCALLPILPVALLGPEIFAFVFGDAWRVAGEVAVLLSVLTFFQTVSSPLSSTVLIAGWIRFEFLWQLSRMAMSATCFYICYLYGSGYMFTIGANVIVLSFLYLLHSIWQYKAAGASVAAESK